MGMEAVEEEYQPAYPKIKAISTIKDRQHSNHSTIHIPRDKLTTSGA